jgi:hypothetical protein
VWKNGGLDDIAGMSLRPVWIDDEAPRPDGSASSPAPPVQLVAPAAPWGTILPPAPFEHPSTPGELDALLEDRTIDDALPARPQMRGYLALAVGMAVLAIASWSALLVRVVRDETFPAADEQGPDAVTTGIAPTPGGVTAPPAGTGAPLASSSPSASANAPADPPHHPRIPTAARVGGLR